MEERFQTFTVLITNVYRSIHRIKAEEMAEFELKSSHVSCLYYLYLHDSLTAKELCDICEEDKANISRSIKYLEENGFLVRSESRQKKYQTPIVLTEKGRMIGKRIAQRIDSILKSASNGLDEEQRFNFYKSLALISTNLQKICDTYDCDEQAQNINHEKEQA